MVQTVFRQFRRSITSALFPDRCLLCDRLYHRPWPVAEQNRNIRPRSRITAFASFAKQVVCDSCTPKFSMIESPVCTMCGMMFISREGEDHVCGNCCKHPKHFMTARAAAVYDNLLMHSVLLLKYKGRTGLANPLGRILLFAFLRYFSTQNPDIIIPVPLHPQKMRQRGFNQVFLMIHDWEQQLPEHGYHTPFQIRKNILQKDKNTTAQTGLSKNRRIRNIKDAFRLENGSDIAGKNILIVDDVYTTGSTVNECARVLRKGGANRVDVLTLARAV